MELELIIYDKTVENYIKAHVISGKNAIGRNGYDRLSLNFLLRPIYS